MCSIKITNYIKNEKLGLFIRIRELHSHNGNGNWRYDLWAILKPWQILFVVLTNLEPDKNLRLYKEKLWENISTFKI